VVRAPQKRILPNGTTREDRKKGKSRFPKKQVSVLWIALDRNGGAPKQKTPDAQEVLLSLSKIRYPMFTHQPSLNKKWSKKMTENMGRQGGADGGTGGGGGWDGVGGEGEGGGERKGMVEEVGKDRERGGGMDEGGDR